MENKPTSGKAGNDKKKRKKKGAEVTLGNTKVFQPNRVTNAQYTGFTLVRVRCFLAIMKHLQPAIKSDMSGKDWTQLSIFESSSARTRIQILPDATAANSEIETEEGVIRSGSSGPIQNYQGQQLVKVQVELSEIGPPEQYPDIFQAFDSLRFLTLKLDPPKGYKRSNASIVARVDESELVGGKSFVSLYLLREVVDQLILTTKNMQGTPEQYTSYVYEVAMGFRGKYTALLYLLISSWKNKGLFTISLEKLRAQLGIEGEYTEYSDFKRRVLIPAAKEIFKSPLAECYFNPDPENPSDFEIRNGKQVVQLRFKVLTRETDEQLQLNYENIRFFLRNRGRFDDADFEKLKPIFRPETTPARVQQKWVELLSNLEKNEGKDARGEPIIDIKSWFITCLLNEFGGQLQIGFQ